MVFILFAKKLKTAYTTLGPNVGNSYVMAYFVRPNLVFLIRLDNFFTWTSDSSGQEPLLILSNDVPILSMHMDHTSKALTVVKHVHQLTAVQHQVVLWRKVKMIYGAIDK